jgi:6-pyruvoyltetrahydropterin/6-carboxytetrahydropterin synthase
MFELKVTNHFAAAHQLEMVAKKCENLHGHNWKIEVRIAGDQLNDAGVVMDFGKIKQHVSATMKTLDHKFLNDLECFKGGNPSSENIAKYIADTLQGTISEPSIRVASVTAWESDDACATYFPDKLHK